MESRGMEGGGGHSPCSQNAQPLAGDKLGTSGRKGLSVILQRDGDVTDDLNGEVIKLKQT